MCRPRHWPSGVAISGPAATGRVGRPAGREIVPTQRSSVSRSPSGPASYSGRPFVSKTSGPKATAPSVCAVGTGGSTHLARGAGAESGRRTTANWLSARTSSAPLPERTRTLSRWSSASFSRTLVSSTRSTPGTVRIVVSIRIPGSSCSSTSASPSLREATN